MSTLDLDLHLLVGEALLTLLAFLILLYVIYKFAWKPFNATIEARQAKIQDDWDQAEQAKKATQEVQSQIDHQLKSAHVEADKIIRQATIEASHTHDNMLAKTRDEQAKMIQATQEDLKKQRDQFALDMQESLVHMATAMASKVLAREVNPDDHQKMIEEFIKRLEGLDEQF